MGHKIGYQERYWSKTGHQQRSTLTAEDVVESVEVEVRSQAVSMYPRVVKVLLRVLLLDAVALVEVWTCTYKRREYE